MQTWRLGARPPDPWADVGPTSVALMLEANLPPTVAERVAWSAVYWRLHNPDPAQDGACDTSSDS